MNDSSCRPSFTWAMRSFPIWQSRSSCGGGRQLARSCQSVGSGANPKWYVRSVTSPEVVLSGTPPRHGYPANYLA